MSEAPGIPSQTPGPTIPEIPIINWIETAMPYLIVLAAVVIVLALWSMAKYTLDRNRALKIPEDSKSRNRLLFMDEARRLSKGSVTKPVRTSKVAKKFGWSAALVNETRNYLQDKGLVKLLPPRQGVGTVLEGLSGPRITVTARGMEEVEAAHRNPSTPTEFLPAALTVYGSISNSQIMQNVSESSQAHVEGDVVEAAIKFSAAFQDALRASPLPEPAQARASAQLGVLGVETRQERPDQATLREAGKSLRTIAEGAGASALWAGIAALGQQLGF